MPGNTIDNIKLQILEDKLRHDLAPKPEFLDYIEEIPEGSTLYVGTPDGDLFVASVDDFCAKWMLSPKGNFSIYISMPDCHWHIKDLETEEDIDTGVVASGRQGSQGEQGPRGNDGKSAYDIACEEGYIGTKEEWLRSLVGADGEKGERGETGLQGERGPRGLQGVKGEDGVDGADGAPGIDGRGIVSITKTASEGLADIYTILYTDDTTSTFTVINGKNGTNGKSAYEQAVEAGYIGTIDEWLDSLKGAAGPTGPEGTAPHIDEDSGHWFIGAEDTGVEAQGPAGPTGADFTYDMFTPEQLAALKGETGPTGAAGYSILSDEGEPYQALGRNNDVYVDLRNFDFYKKESDEWFLRGNIKGDSGNPGDPGLDGRGIVSITLSGSAENVDVYTILYSDASTSSFMVTNGLNGAPGNPGNPGKSAYEIAKELDPSIGTETEWIASLKGETGPTGIPGNDGNPGNDGKDGKSMLSGAGAPLSSTGNNGDTWLDVITGDLYKKDSDVWTQLGYGLKGEIGLTGATGPTGAAGQDGATPQIIGGKWWINGASTGVDATGPKGEQGIQGPQGDRGLKGDTGAQGVQGEKGDAGASLITGQGIPLAQTGNDYDTYLNTANGDIYTKSSAGWSKTSSLSVAPVIWSGGVRNDVYFSAFNPGYQTLTELKQFRAFILTFWQQDADPQRAFSVVVSTGFLLSTVRAIHVPVTAHIIEPNSQERLEIGDIEVYLLSGDNGLGLKFYPAYLVPGDPSSTFYFKPWEGVTNVWLQEIVGVK